jgi:hypothetical protein
MQFVFDANTGKYYDESVVSGIQAIDPNSFDEQVATLNEQVTSLQDQIAVIQDIQIPALQATKAAYEAFVTANTPQT